MQAHYVTCLHALPQACNGVGGLLSLLGSSRLSGGPSGCCLIRQWCPAHRAGMIHFQPGQDAGLVEAVLAGQLHHLALGLKL